MRNLKRALSLLLSSTMVLGMLVMGSSAASYTDVTSEENVEAIEVLKAVGVMTGDENGNFNPDKNVTRNEMAVVMANMLNLDVDYYDGAQTSFTDVPQWAAKYVAACQANGIIAGYSDTFFGGSDNVTAAQAALMMMKALGYFQFDKDFGNDWQLATVKQASKIALFDNISAGATTALTRNEVAQLALNTLEATMVESDGSNTTITTGDITISTGDTKYVKVTKTGATQIDSTEQVEGTPTVQLGEDLYDGDLVKRAGTTDAMGRPATDWTYKSTSIGTYADEADYTAYVTASNDTLAEVVEDINKKFDISNATITVNGVAGSVSVGDYVEIYMDADDAEAVEYIAVTHKSVAKLTGDAATKVDDDDTLVKVPGISALAGYKAANTTETVHGYAGLVEDDIVLWYKDNEDNYYLEKAQSFTGTLTAVSGTKYTIDGTKYNKSGVDNVLNSNAIDVTGFYSDAATWYVDNDNNIVWVEGVESTELAYVVDAADPQDDWLNTTHKAKLMTMDGTIITVETEDSASALKGKFVKYSVDSDDVYTLSAATGYVAGTTEGQVATTASEGDEIIITKGNPTITVETGTTVLANSNTVFLVRDYKADGTAKESYTLYTGYAKVPTMSGLATDAVATVYAGSNGYAQYVVVDPKTNITGSTSADDLFYVVSSTVTTLYDTDGICGYTVKAIKNGSDEIVDLEFSFDPSTTVAANGNTAIAADKAYTVSTYNDDGQITSYSTAIVDGGEYVVGSTGTSKANDGTFKLGTSAYAYTDDTVVYFIDEDNDLTIISVEDLEDDVNNKFVAIRATDNTSSADYNTIETLFVSEVVADAVAPTFGTNLNSTDTATVGTEKTFAVVVNNSTGYDVAYAWYVNGEKVAGADTATLSYTFASDGTATVYCVVTYTANTAAVDGVLTSTATSTVCTVTVSAA